MGKHLITIAGHKVYCEDDRSYYGVKYLAYKIPDSQALEMFHQVEAQREVDFVDDVNRKFTLIDGENGSFTVVATNVSHGWF